VSVSAVITPAFQFQRVAHKMWSSLGFAECEHCVRLQPNGGVNPPYLSRAASRLCARLDVVCNLVVSTDGHSRLKVSGAAIRRVNRERHRLMLPGPRRLDVEYVALPLIGETYQDLRTSCSQPFENANHDFHQLGSHGDHCKESSLSGKFGPTPSVQCAATASDPRPRLPLSVSAARGERVLLQRARGQQATLVVAVAHSCGH
jgi:hypothetical protein